LNLLTRTGSPSLNFAGAAIFTLLYTVDKSFAIAGVTSHGQILQILKDILTIKQNSKASNLFGINKITKKDIIKDNYNYFEI
jgi:hypothetical protein